MLIFADNMHLPFLVLSLMLKKPIMMLFVVFLGILSTDEYAGLIHS